MQYLLSLMYRDGEGPQEGTPEFDAVCLTGPAHG